MQTRSAGLLEFESSPRESESPMLPVTPQAIVLRLDSLAGVKVIETLFTAPKTVVLPLDDTPICQFS